MVPVVSLLCIVYGCYYSWLPKLVKGHEILNKKEKFSVGFLLQAYSQMRTASKNEAQAGGILCIFRKGGIRCLLLGPRYSCQIPGHR
jgi:hypothetical protein